MLFNDTYRNLIFRNPYIVFVISKLRMHTRGSAENKTWERVIEVELFLWITSSILRREICFGFYRDIGLSKRTRAREEKSQPRAIEILWMGRHDVALHVSAENPITTINITYNWKTEFKLKMKNLTEAHLT